MKIDVGVLNEKEVVTTNNDGQINMRLSKDATTIVFQMFTKNIYSNPIGTIVREITSNCFDSHIEANVNKPVIIRKTFDKKDNTYYISFIDFGVGISPERMKEIYSVYFESTKRDDNNQIGGYGIGAKSVLAYRRITGYGTNEYDNSFYVITTFNKIKYYYCIYEGKESPVISLLHSESTTDGNGTEIKIPVLEKDIPTFEREMVKQLYYFENIIFEGIDKNNNYDLKPTNDYQIVKGKSFYYRGNDYSKYIHVCLGKVAYPIDYNVLNLNQSEYYLPIAIKFNVGDIKVTVSREQLDYDENTIRLIKKKLIEVKEELISLLNKQFKNIVTLKDFFEYTQNYNILKFGNGKSLNLQGLIKKEDIDLSNFRYKELKLNALTKDTSLFNFFFNIRRLGDKPKKYEKKEFYGEYNSLISDKNIYYVENEFKRKQIKSTYLKSLHKTYYLITKRNILNNRLDISDIFKIALNSTTDENGKPVKIVKTMLKMQEEFFNIVRENAINYDNLELPDNFVIKRISKKKNDFSDITIPVKFIHHSINRIKVEKLEKFNGVIFYSNLEEEYKLNNSLKIFELLFDNNHLIWGYCKYNDNFKSYNHNITNNGIMFIRVAQNNIKYLESCKNAYHISQFTNKMLYRKRDLVINYLQSNEIFSKYQNLSPLYKRYDFNSINEKYGKIILKVNEYFKKLNNINTDIKYHKDELIRLLNIGDIELNDEQKDIMKKLEQLYQLEENNEKILRYFNTYNINYNKVLDDVLVDILKKVMVF
ncbi:MAG TPA: hypothetical protein PLN85_00620 [archaeon]|nr:hypothetical protein [archaeon]